MTDIIVAMHESVCDCSVSAAQYTRVNDFFAPSQRQHSAERAHYHMKRQNINVFITD